MKKTTTFTALICLLNTFLCAQNSPIKFGISINPNYSYRYLYSDIPDLKTSFDAIDVGKFSYSIGAFGEKEINNKARFRIGINLMNTGFGTKKLPLTTGSSLDPQGFPSFTNPNDPIAGRFIFNDIKIELPIDFQFFINKKQSFFIDFGMSPILNIYSYSTFKTYFSDGRINSSSSSNNDPNIRKLALAAQLGIGYEFKLNEKLTMEIQPKCQYFLTTLINSKNKSGMIPYNLGLQMGLKF
jgi:hypothetical protein